MKLMMTNLPSSVLKKLITRIHNICIASAIILWIIITAFLLGMLYLIGIEGRDTLEQLLFK